MFVLDVVSMRCPLSSPCFVRIPTTPAKRRETGRCKEKQKHTTLHPATSSVTRPYPPEDIEAGADELVPSSPAPRTRRDALDAFAATTPRTRGSNCHGRATTETRVTSGSRTPRCSISSAAGWTRGSSRTNAWETLTRRTASPSSPNRNLNRHRRQTGTATPATRTTTRTFRTCDLGGSAWFRSWTCST